MKNRGIVTRPFDPLNKFLSFNKSLIYYIVERKQVSHSNLLEIPSEPQALPSLNKILFTNTVEDTDKDVIVEDITLIEEESTLGLLYPCKKNNTFFKVAKV